MVAGHDTNVQLSKLRITIITIAMAVSLISSPTPTTDVKMMYHIEGDLLVIDLMYQTPVVEGV